MNCSLPVAGHFAGADAAGRRSARLRISLVRLPRSPQGRHSQSTMIRADAYVDFARANDDAILPSAFAAFSRRSSAFDMPRRDVATASQCSARCIYRHAFLALMTSISDVAA